jgi:hypothetical protein
VAQNPLVYLVFKHGSGHRLQPVQLPIANLVCRIAGLLGLAFLIAGVQNVVADGRPARSTSPATGDWGFDLTGADLGKKPGDDFFRYSNGVWYDL